MTVQIAGLDHTEQNTLDRLMRQYYAKITRNQVRRTYYDAKNVLRDLGIAIPPDLVNIDMVLGWPAKAVDGLSRRCKLDGFVVPGMSTTDLGVDDMWIDNRMAVEVPQAHTSAFTYSCGFVSTTKGDTQSGEPEVLITSRSAMYGTGLWNRRSRQLSSSLAIVDVSDSGQPTELILYLPDQTISAVRKGESWSLDRRRHSLGRVPVEMLVYKPNLDRPFGMSRISRPVISLADQALRTAVRMEVSAEFYSSPQRWIMGADESAFQDAEGNLKGQWESIIGRIWAVGRDESGEIPTVGQFNAASQQPSMEQMRQLAMQFAGETSIPVNSLGIIQDNPSSAEAINTAKEDLFIEAEFSNEVFGTAWVGAVLTGLQLREGWDKIPPEIKRLRARWRNPRTMSQSAAADATLKTVSTFPWLADSEVALEQLGWDETTIARAMADKRRSMTSQLVQQLSTASELAAADPQVQQLAAKRVPDADAE